MSADSTIAASNPPCLSAPATDAKTAPDVASLDAVQKKDVKANVHWTYWVLAFVLSCVLFLDLTVYSFPLPFLPQHLDSLGYSAISISVVMSIILFSSIVTTLANTIYTTQRKQVGNFTASPSERALISSASTTSLAASLLSDQNSSREFFIFSAIIFDVVSLVIAGFYPEYAIFMVSRALQGAASAFSWIFCLSLITDLFPSSVRGVAISMALSGTNLAEVVGPVMGGTLFHKFGLSVSFFAVAGLAALIGVMFIGSVWLRRTHGPAPAVEPVVPDAREVAATIQGILTAQPENAKTSDPAVHKPAPFPTPRMTDEQKFQICIEMYAELERAQPAHNQYPELPEIPHRISIHSPSQLAGKIAADREFSVSRSRSRSVSRSQHDRSPVSRSRPDRSPASLSLGAPAAQVPPLVLDKQPATESTADAKPEDPTLIALKSTHSAFTDPVIIALSVAAMLVAAVRTCVDIITPLYLDYQLGLDEFSVGIVFGVEAVCCIIASIAAGAAMKRLSPRWVIVAFTAVFGCLCMVVFLRQEVIYVYILYGSIGTAIGIANLACSQWVTDRADELPGVDTDSAMSLFNLLWFGGYAIGGVIGGLPAASDMEQQKTTLMALAAAMMAFIPVFIYLTRKSAQTKGLSITPDQSS